MNSRVVTVFTLLLLVLAMCLLSYRCYEIGEVLRDIHQATKAPITSHIMCNLPCKCAPLYNLGTDAWIECMGVGYK